MVNSKKEIKKMDGNGEGLAPVLEFNVQKPEPDGAMKKVGARKNEWLDSQLISAVRKGNADEVERLLNMGADVNATDTQSGWTVLMYAAYYKQNEIAELLILRGAEVNEKSLLGETALTFACGNGNKKLAELLISKGADVNAKTITGMTALMYASSNGYKEIVELLLLNKADVNARNKYGETALMFACENGHKEVVDFLISKGADVNARTMSGRTALTIAIKTKHRNEEIVRMLKNMHAVE